MTLICEFLTKANCFSFFSYQQIFECGLSIHYLKIEKIIHTSVINKKELGIKYPDSNFVEPLKLGEISRNSLLFLLIGNFLGIIFLIFEILHNLGLLTFSLDKAIKQTKSSTNARPWSH